MIIRLCLILLRQLSFHILLFIENGKLLTKGNQLTYTILRGYNNKHGESTLNYHYEDILRLINMYDEDTYQNLGTLIDCNHSNSDKQFEE